MKKTITITDFCDAFHTMQRQDQFSYYALRELFDHFVALEEDTGTEIELDVVAICCGYIESTLEEINADYSEDFEAIQEASDWLSENTAVVVIHADDHGQEVVVYQQF